MTGLLLIVITAAVGGWFAWLYYVSPAADEARIKSDHGGTDTRVIKIERVGTKRERGALDWVADQPRAGPAKWFRIYEVTLAKPHGYVESHTVGVEARLFGLPELKSFDLRA